PIICSCRRHSVLLRLCGELLCEGLLLLAFLLSRQRSLNGRFYFRQWTGVRRLLLFHLDDVIAEFGFHQSGNLSRLQRERRLVELRNRCAMLEETQLAALILASRIV